MRPSDKELCRVFEKEDTFRFGMNDASTLVRVVFPERVPPEMGMLSPRSTDFMSTFASCRNSSYLVFQSFE
jgi:hypothetical protein